MFGIVAAQLSTIDDEEKKRYRRMYCGLCHSLKEVYGQVARTCLNYDLTFYLLLANSLNEPEEFDGSSRCLMHPVKTVDYTRTKYSDYAADLTVALAYYKCLDDWNDEKKKSAKFAEKMLSRSYETAKKRIPEQCAFIGESMERISELEKGGADTPPDAAAIEFGRLLGELFAYDQAPWEDEMRKFGSELGRFIYLMDAAIDVEQDRETGNYNPFVLLNTDPQNMKTLLAVLIGNAVDTFERLPLERDLHLMESVLYSGVWQKFNEAYEKKDDSKNVKEGQKDNEGAMARPEYNSLSAAAPLAFERNVTHD